MEGGFSYMSWAVKSENMRVQQGPREATLLGLVSLARILQNGISFIPPLSECICSKTEQEEQIDDISHV